MVNVPAGATLGALPDILVIAAAPPGARERLSRWLRGRRLLLAGILALAEIIGVLIWRSNTLLLAALAVVVLILAVAAATRLRQGPLRDVLWIVAIAQGIVVLIPLLVGFSVVVAVLVAVALIAGLVMAAVKWRV